MTSRVGASRPEFLWLATMMASILVCSLAATAVGSMAGVAALDNMAAYAGKVLFLSIPIIFLLCIGALALAAVRREPHPLPGGHGLMKLGQALKVRGMVVDRVSWNYRPTLSGIAAQRLFRAQVIGDAQHDLENE